MAQGRLRRLVTRRRVKWVGAVLCVLVLGVYIASAWYGVGWWFREPNRAGFLGINRGRLIFFVNHFRPPYGKRAPLAEPFRFLALEDPSIDLRPRWAMSHSTVGFQSSGFTLFTPLWLPLLLLAAPTAYLWRTDRRAKPWQCPKCRYDLRGLDGGVCPECGTPIAEPAK